MQWGSNEPYWKSTQRSQSITLIKNPPQQDSAPVNFCTKEIFLGNHGLWKKKSNVSSKSPSLVESGSRSQPHWKFSPGQISQACPHQHLEIKTLLKHECIWTEKLNYMWWKSTLKYIHEAAFPGSSLPHLIFRGRAPTSISDPDSSVKIAREHSGRPAATPNELCSKPQQPHDAIFRI